MEQKPSGNSQNIESYIVTLGSKESKIKIGKVLDDVNFSNSQIVNDGKNFCLYEKKAGKSDTKYIGSSLAEQTSKYLIFRFNESTRRLEAYPVNEWYSFKKEIYLAQTLTLEEVEEKMKPQVSVINLFKKKGVVEPPKKGKRKKNANQKNVKGGNEIELLDELPHEKEEPLPKENDDLNDSELDPELKDIPSDIEEGLQQTKEPTLIEKTLATQNDEPKSVDESNDSFDVDDNENDLDDYSDDFENAPSEINEEEVDKGMAQAQMGMIGLKRKRDDDGNEGKKSRSTFSEMEEALDNMLARNKQMTYEKIAKEMARRYSTYDIEMYLKPVLDKNTKMFTQGSETYYFKKFE